MGDFRRWRGRGAGCCEYGEQKKNRIRLRHLGPLHPVSPCSFVENVATLSNRLAGFAVRAKSISGSGAGGMAGGGAGGGVGGLGGGSGDATGSEESAPAPTSAVWASVLSVNAASAGVVSGGAGAAAAAVCTAGA